MRVAEILEAECGREGEIGFLPMQPGGARQSFADITAIQREPGFQPTTSIDVGVPSFVCWHRDYHAG